MAKVGQKNTKPEMIVRSKLHALGYRFRIHRKDLPGTPDIVLPKYKLVIFVHGCFWHRHDENKCKLTTTPKTRLKFWNDKFRMNQARDIRKQKELEQLGWQVVTIWECQTRDITALTQTLTSVLSHFDYSEVSDGAD